MGEKCIHGVRGRVCGDCHAEDMEAEVDRQDRVIQGLRDEIERLTAESKAKDVAYETMQKYVTELEARVEELEDLLDEAFRKLVSMLIHDDEAYSKLQEMADEIERLRARVEALEKAWSLGREITIGPEGMDFTYKSVEEALGETEQGEKDSG